MGNEILLNSLKEAHILGIFKNICEDYLQASERNKLRNMIAISTNKTCTIKSIVMRKYNIEVDDYESTRLLELIQAFLHKSDYRKAVSKEIKEKLLIEQNYKCSFCGRSIDISAPADHIVPFKYVGDCLKDNLQMLCSKCNDKKNDSLDYQVRFLLNLVRS